MAHDGTRGPKPYQQTAASTCFLRVPMQEWPAVSRGAKREFRAPAGPHSQLHKLKPPAPVVAYAVGRDGEHKGMLMVLTEMWQEPLGAISEESLRNEGFNTLAEFRRAWMLRNRRRFQPARVTTVYRVRPWLPSDVREMADKVFEHLYGDWVDV